MTRTRIRLALVATAATTLARGGCQKKAAPRETSAAEPVVTVHPENVALATATELRSGAVISGSLEPANRATLRAEVSGSVQRMEVDVGQRVKPTCSRFVSRPDLPIGERLDSLEAALECASAADPSGAVALAANVRARPAGCPQCRGAIAGGACRMGGERRHSRTGRAGVRDRGCPLSGRAVDPNRAPRFAHPARASAGNTRPSRARSSSRQDACVAAARVATRRGRGRQPRREATARNVAWYQRYTSAGASIPGWQQQTASIGTFTRPSQGGATNR